MLYVLVDESNHVCAVQDADSVDEWVYPEDEFTLIEVEDFEFDETHDLYDYIYENGTFALDEAGIAEREENKAYDPFEIMAALMQQTEILDTLPDDVMAHMASYMEEWSGDGVAYVVGDKRQYDDKPYRCLQAHTSQASWNPKDAPSLWARILASADPDNPLPWEQPDSTNPYMKGDRVTHNGKVWESDVDNNVWEPGVYGWTEVA